MSANVKIKRSAVSGNPSILGAGELAYSSLADTGSNGGDRLYIGMGTETAGDAVDHIVIGGKYFTDIISAATNSNTASTLVLRNSNGDFSAGTINASFNGTLTGTSSSSTKWDTARNLSLTGDATTSLLNIDGTTDVSAAITLANVNSDIGSFGSSTQVPIVTVNAKGLITSVTLSTISGIGGSGSSELTIAGNTGTDTITTGTDTLTFVGNTGVITIVTDNQVSFEIGQAVSPISNVVFNDVTVNGVLYSNDITATSVNVAGNATITGNLTVNGTTTTINSTTLLVSDLNIVVAKNATSASAANGAGLTVYGPSVPATLVYSSYDDRWNLNKALNVSAIYGTLEGNALTATSWQNPRELSLTGDGTASLSVDGSAPVSSTLTLATVNSNIGDFGDTISVPSFTVNAKGLITAAANVAIATATDISLGLASFSAANFLVDSGAVTVSAIDGGIY